MRQRELDKYSRDSEHRWRAKFDQMPAKVGTVPMTIWVTHEVAKQFVEGTLAVDTSIDFYEEENGQRRRGYVTKLEPILFITRC